MQHGELKKRKNFSSVKLLQKSGQSGFSSGMSPRARYVQIQRQISAGRETSMGVSGAGIFCFLFPSLVFSGKLPRICRGFTKF